MTRLTTMVVNLLHTRQRFVVVAVGVLVMAASCSRTSGSNNPSASAQASGIHKIKHVVVIQQENRSFDSYFGTFPGADGIPMKDGKPSVCVNDPATHTCVAPYVDHADVNGGGPHNAKNSSADVNGGKM